MVSLHRPMTHLGATSRNSLTDSHRHTCAHTHTHTPHKQTLGPKQRASLWTLTLCQLPLCLSVFLFFFFQSCKNATTSPFKLLQCITLPFKQKTGLYTQLREQGIKMNLKQTKKTLLCLLKVSLNHMLHNTGPEVLRSAALRRPRCSANATRRQLKSRPSVF